MCARQLVDGVARRVTDGRDGGVREARDMMVLTPRALPVPSRWDRHAGSLMAVMVAFEKRAA